MFPRFMLQLLGPFFPQKNIHLRMINSQYFMLAHTVFHNISIYTYKQYIFLIFMLAYGVYVTHPLKLVKVE